jgi:predicted TIM-barrel fold metal-dependent hydrolase
MSLYNPSLIDIFNMAAETGLVATLHNDIYEADVSHDGKILSTSSEPHYLSGMKYLCKASPNANVIWAHTGLGRFVQPNQDHLHIVSDMLDSCPNWFVDISWDLVQQVIINPKPGMPTLKDWAAFITKYQDRVLWGSDTVLYSSNKINGDEVTKGKPISAEKYHEVVDVSDPLLDALDEDVAHKVRMTNYLKLFDAARINVRAWEKLHANDDVWNLPASVLTEHTDLVFAY